MVSELVSVLREEHRLRVDEKKVPRKIFGPKRKVCERPEKSSC